MYLFRLYKVSVKFGIGGVLTDYKYAGFMSYSHADEAVAERLHHALETFKIPRDLSLSTDKNLYPIFRDTTELTAHHSLSEKIQDAVNTSRFLIVLCSPAAKSSHWVNEEIRLFRSLHGEASILCVLIEGTPETSFPPSLIEGGREPLAANLGRSRDSFRLGVTQLAASMLGVGLDALIRRETKRRRVRTRLLTTGSVVFAALMGSMAWTAVNARDAAEVSRTEAEKMVEFMLTDLKQDLEPVGRLNILDDVGNRVTDYYNAIPLPDMDDDRLARQARARHLLAQVAVDQGKMDKAKDEIDAAYQATEEVLRRNPENTDAIFAHAQSAYWLGLIHYYLGNLAEVETPWLEYNKLGQELYKSDKKNFDWVMEAAWGQNNLGTLSRHHYSESKTRESITYYSQAITYFKEALAINPDSKSAKYELSNVLAGRASGELAFGTAKQSRAFKIDELEYRSSLIEDFPYDKKLDFEKLKAELNYYHNFFLELSESQEKSVKGLLQKLYEMTLHDPENLSYKISFLDYTFEYISKMDLPSKIYLLPEIKEVTLQLSDDTAGKDYYLAMLGLAEMKRYDIDDLRLKNIAKEKRLRLYYIYFLREKNPKTAQNFLSAINEVLDLPYPTLLDKRIRAYRELDKCSEVSIYTKALHSRGFSQTHLPDVKECRTPD